MLLLSLLLLLVLLRLLPCHCRCRAIVVAPAAHADVVVAGDCRVLAVVAPRLLPPLVLLMLLLMLLLPVVLPIQCGYTARCELQHAPATRAHLLGTLPSMPSPLLDRNFSHQRCAAHCNCHCC
jgi:hypothetical protein